MTFHVKIEHIGFSPTTVKFSLYIQCYYILKRKKEKKIRTFRHSNIISIIQNATFFFKKKNLNISGIIIIIIIKQN